MAEHFNNKGERLESWFEAHLDAERKAFADGIADRKLVTIKEIRLSKLKETDYLANSDLVMTDEMKTYRQGMRDIPQNNTTEEQYDLLLAKVDGELTHALWSKPE